MTDPLSLALAALAYLLAGRYWWRRMVLPGPEPSVDVLFEGTRENHLYHWRRKASADEARGDLAILLPKANFVLFWPLALVVAAARFRR